jgi:hypothetical protein
MTSGCIALGPTAAFYLVFSDRHAFMVRLRTAFNRNHSMCYIHTQTLDSLDIHRHWVPSSMSHFIMLPKITPNPVHTLLTPSVPPTVWLRFQSDKSTSPASPCQWRSPTPAAKHHQDAPRLPGFGAERGSALATSAGRAFQCRALLHLCFPSSCGGRRERVPRLPPQQPGRQPSRRCFPR